jgi:hypothetical protein
MRGALSGLNCVSNGWLCVACKERKFEAYRGCSGAEQLDKYLVYISAPIVGIAGVIAKISNSFFVASLGISYGR